MYKLTQQEFNKWSDSQKKYSGRFPNNWILDDSDEKLITNVKGDMTQLCMGNDMKLHKLNDVPLHIRRYHDKSKASEYHLPANCIFVEFPL